jgi:hypothetical protein
MASVDASPRASQPPPAPLAVGAQTERLPLDYLHTLGEVAVRLRKGRNQVGALIASQALRAKKVAGTWRITEAALREYLGEALEEPVAAPPPPPAVVSRPITEWTADDYEALGQAYLSHAALMRVRGQS